jgi:AcrR family transcriptional regulator
VTSSSALPPEPDRTAAKPAGLPARPRLDGRHRQPPRRRTALTASAIVDAALEVLDAEGVTGLSMRRVAERLGTGPASLYAHVSSKDELLELVYDELIGRVPLPEPDPERWEEQIRDMMRGLRDVLAAHRDTALAGLGRIPTTPKSLAAAEAVTAVLKAGGLSDLGVALGLDHLVLHVCATALEESLYRHSGMPETELARYFEDVHTFYQALPPDRYPALASVAEDMTGHDGEERFEFGLTVLIEGLRAADRAGSSRAPSQLDGAGAVRP